MIALIVTPNFIQPAQSHYVQVAASVTGVEIFHVFIMINTWLKSDNKVRLLK